MVQRTQRKHRGKSRSIRKHRSVRKNRSKRKDIRVRKDRSKRKNRGKQRGGQAGFLGSAAKAVWHAPSNIVKKKWQEYQRKKMQELLNTLKDWKMSPSAMTDKEGINIFTVKNFLTDSQIIAASERVKRLRKIFPEVFGADSEDLQTKLDACETECEERTEVATDVLVAASDASLKRIAGEAVREKIKDQAAATNDPENPLAVLGVSKDASCDEQKKAYYALVRTNHEAMNPGDPAAAEKMSELNTAYDACKKAGDGE